MTRVAQTRHEAGFSLPEVTIALGMLAAVLISIAGLFVISAKLVHEGGNRSAAVTVAENIIEETHSWGYRTLYEQFGLDGTASSYVIDTRVNLFASRWQEELDPLLREAHAEIVLESVAAGGSPPPLQDALCIRISVRVVWKEAKPEREVRLATIRM